ncbi:hypothetical protein TWF225_001031 [Orbilia oligospora]|nr:hypothetical protein TWF225_001031 [Orbilia oligospora]KAF3237859.1 hypothetical protein TWF128_000745 [Orbilia oligospora]KAF3238436.1 hypothetical protein TWF217_001710 [Orbilia oligospora]KAF3273950.1 hypothetical protein TWF132_004471 [Orbilia oligospora]
MPLKPFTLAVLECDQPLDHARIDLGGHTGVWSALFADAADAQGIPRDRIKVIGYNAEEGLPTLDGSGNKDTGEERIDAVLVSGSRYNAWGDDAWIINLVEFVRECVEKKVPVIGICFGHQVVGRALGAEVGRSENGWEVAPTRLVVSEAGKGVFGKDEIVSFPFFYISFSSSSFFVSFFMIYYFLKEEGRKEGRLTVFYYCKRHYIS